jgi:hypothetical protein
MNETPRQAGTAGHRSTPVQLGPPCIHDLPRATCAVCTRHPDLRDADYQYEMGTGETGWGYYSELSR